MIINMKYWFYNIIKKILLFRFGLILNQNYPYANWFGYFPTKTQTELPRNRTKTEI